MMQLTILGALLFTVILTACGDSADSTTRYEVTVNFNTSVTQDDLEKTRDILQAYDRDLDFLIMELFPPIGRAVLTTDESDFCSTIETDLEAETYVRSVVCQKWEEPDTSLSPEEPVQSGDWPNPCRLIPMATHTELHCHSCYSLREGASTPEELVLRARELGHDALGPLRRWTNPP